MRLIDADKLFPLKCVPILPYDGYGTAERMIEMVKNAPTVELVHCKDCKKFMEYTEEYTKSVEGADGECYIRVMHSDDEQYQTCKYDDFCSYAERKENNG